MISFIIIKIFIKIKCTLILHVSIQILLKVYILWSQKLQIHQLQQSLSVRTSLADSKVWYGCFKSLNKWTIKQTLFYRLSLMHKWIPNFIFKLEAKVYENKFTIQYPDQYPNHYTGSFVHLLCLNLGMCLKNNSANS